MAMLAGRLDKFRFYKSTDAALRYIQSLRRGPQVTSTPPEPGIADLMDQLARCHGRMAEQHRQDMLECEEVPEFEERFRELFREFPHAVFYFDLWGRFAWGNRNAEELFGYPMEELVGRAYFETEIPTLETLRKVARLLSEDPAPARGAPQLSAPAPRRLSVTAFRGDGARLRLAISHRVVSFGSKHVILCLAARSPVLGIRKT
jgi:PAS domain-containing protein